MQAAAIISYNRGDKRRGRHEKHAAHSAKERSMNGLAVDHFAASIDKKDAPRRTPKEINCLWASRIGGRIVGLAHLVGAEGQAVAVTLFRVDPEYRHTAILTNLIDRVRDFCGERGCPRSTSNRTWRRTGSCSSSTPAACGACGGPSPATSTASSSASTRPGGRRTLRPAPPTGTRSRPIGRRSRKRSASWWGQIPEPHYTLARGRLVPRTPLRLR